MDFGTSAALASILESFTRRQDERNAIVTQFTAKNPFVFDEVLAQKTLQAREQLDPYYNQQLSDYISGIEKQKGRSLEDSRLLLSELSQDASQYKEDSAVKLELALDRAGQGATEVGLYNSGAGKRQEGLLKRDQNLGLGNYNQDVERQTGNINRTLSRSLEDMQRESNIFQRDQQAERSSNIGQYASDLTREEGIKYGYALRQALGHLADENGTGDVLGGLV